jgi:Flp pilus assembly pilin Flp
VPPPVPAIQPMRSLPSDLHRLLTPLRGDAAEAGQGLIEYGLILSLSAVWAALLLVVFGPALSGFLQAVGDAIDAAT